MTRALPWLCAGAAFVLYAVTLTPSFAWDDSAELAAGVDRLGSVHAIGYPLYVLLGHGFVLLDPFGSPAAQANLWSAVGGAAAVGLVAHYTLRLTGSWLAAVVAALVLATGSVFWMHATAASVYPWQLVSLLLLLLAGERWDECRTPGSLAWLAAAAGLVVVSHRTGLVFALAAAAFVAWRARGALLEDRRNLLALLAIVPVLATFAYVPISIDEARYPNTPKLFGLTAWETINGGNARVAPEAEPLDAGARDTVDHAVKAALLVPAQLSLAAVLLVPLGLISLRQWRSLLWLGLGPALVVSLVAVTTPGSFAYWHLPLLLVCAVLCGAGAARLRAELARRSRGLRLAVLTALGLALATGPLLGAAYVADHRQDAEPWARSVLERLPRGAAILAPFSVYEPLRAAQELEGARRDVRVVYSRDFIRSRQALAGVREPYVVTVSEAALEAPPGLRLGEIVPPEDVEGKGIAGLKLGPARLAEPVQVARVYELRRG